MHIKGAMSGLGLACGVVGAASFAFFWFGVVAVGKAAEGVIPAELGLFREEAVRSETRPEVIADESGRPVLRFADMTRSFAVYDGDAATAKTSLEFKTSGKVSFALLLRGRDKEAPSYIVFVECGASDKGLARLYVAKTPFSFNVDPRGAKLAAKSFAYPEGEWCRLSVALSPRGDGQLEIEVAIQEEGTGRMLLQVAAVDQDDPIMEEGLVALRFFNDSESEGASLEVRGVEFSGADR